MAQAQSVSFGKFTEIVQAAVKAAVQRHPKFKMEPPAQVAISYLIRGIPVAEALVANVPLAETRAFASEIASHITSSPALAALGGANAAEGAVYSRGNHVIIGIPAVTDVLLER